MVTGVEHLQAVFQLDVQEVIDSCYAGLSHNEVTIEAMAVDFKDRGVFPRLMVDLAYQAVVGLTPLEQNILRQR